MMILFAKWTRTTRQVLFIGSLDIAGPEFWSIPKPQTTSDAVHFIYLSIYLPSVLICFIKPNFSTNFRSDLLFIFMSKWRTTPK